MFEDNVFIDESKTIEIFHDAPYWYYVVYTGGEISTAICLFIRVEIEREIVETIVRTIRGNKSEVYINGNTGDIL